MKKERFDVTASSLGSYFGVGFNTPEQQLAYDLGLEENTFDKAAEDRMDLGIFLEDAVLNYFEKKLEITISNRNDKILYACDGKLKCKVDGITVYQGENTVVECKVSNSQSGKFTEDKGYYLQCQAYMQATGYDQVLLLGLYQGKPIYKLIRRDQETIHLIEFMVDFLYDCFNGISDVSDFPYNLTYAYSKKVEPDDVEFDTGDEALMDELYELREASKAHSDRISTIENYFKSKFKNIKFEGNSYTATISSYTRQGGLDTDKIKDDFPTFEEDKYKKAPSEYSTIRITKKKPR